MVGNTYPYTTDDWKQDIVLAASRDIDAFALNVGPEDWQRQSVARCYAAALELGIRFKLFLTFDMTVLRANTREDVSILREYIARFAHHPHQMLYENKVMVSTFAGQDSLFGHSTMHEAWDFVKSTLQEIAQIHLVPSFFIDPRAYPHHSFMDGYFNWNGSWPIYLTVNSTREEVKCAKLDTDRHHIHHLDGRTFMAAVSPWFFTHYGPESWNKNWIYRGDDWLFVRRWEQIIAMRDQIDIVQIVSWNDYGESHYIAPVRGAQPSSDAWVDGFPHDAWLDLTQHFARAFKTGTYPRSRKTGYSYRWQLVSWRFKEPAEVRLSATQDGLSERSYSIGQGLSKLSHPMVAGGGMRARLMRDGEIVAECSPSREEFVVRERPETYNFNVYVASST
ncbi:glycoside hydrolase family 71 protein [Daedaleopsis nitida]|nr:glycoside hydrolase family 71 protein [Daedaleopsis nitida]